MSEYQPIEDVFQGLIEDETFPIDCEQETTKLPGIRDIPLRLNTGPFPFKTYDMAEYRRYDIPTHYNTEHLQPAAKEPIGHWLISYENKHSQIVHTFHCSYDQDLVRFMSDLNTKRIGDYYKVPVGVTRLTLEDFKRQSLSISNSYERVPGVLDCYIWCLNFMATIPYQPCVDYIHNPNYGIVHMYWIKCDSKQCMCERGHTPSKSKSQQQQEQSPRSGSDID